MAIQKSNFDPLHSSYRKKKEKKKKLSLYIYIDEESTN
jgi:hypothetical protein